MGEAIEQSRRHLGIAEHLGPLTEAEVRGDGDTYALIKLAQQVEEQGAAGTLKATNSNEGSTRKPSHGGEVRSEMPAYPVAIAAGLPRIFVFAIAKGVVTAGLPGRCPRQERSARKKLCIQLHASC